MRRLISRVINHLNARVLAGTAFCERCDEVCTAACRQDARVRQYRESSRRDGFTWI